MTGIDSLTRIRDREAIDNIQEMTRCFISQVNPLKVILFGSFADGTYTDESDFDFYIVIEDNRSVGQATDLSFLLNQIKNILYERNGINVTDELLTAADSLSKYGIAPRYPNEIEVDEQMTGKALSDSESILQWAEDVMALSSGTINPDSKQK